MSITSTADDSIIIVGAGIVGSCLARRLAEHLHASVTLVDRNVQGLPGSTGHAPGFVGQLNAIPTLTELAKRTVQHYLTIPGGFDLVGGMEIALNSTDMALLQDRAALAHAAGLSANLIKQEQAVKLAPDFVESGCGALHFPSDGTANAKGIARHEQLVASRLGAKLIDADVQAISRLDDGTYHLDTSSGNLFARHVVFCTGIWASQLLPSLTSSVVSVAHPYSYSTRRSARAYKTPFIRWPSKHVYARDHGVREGIGSYDHAPVHASRDQVASLPTAYGPFEPEFHGILDRAYQLLPSSTADTLVPREAPANYAIHAAEQDDKTYAFNGLFSVTPDGLPLVGALGPTSSYGGLWCAVAVWVTHAAGSAGVLADQILETLGHGQTKDKDLRQALDPLRFDGQNDKELERQALSKYNDIYNKQKQDTV